VVLSSQEKNINDIMYKLILIILIILFSLLLFQTHQAFRLKYLEGKIFPFTINDMHLNPNIELEPYYWAFKPYTSDIQELSYLMKYKKFIHKKTYSMGAQNEINQTHQLMKLIHKNNVVGDIIEAGVWRGGMAMWIKANLNYYGLNKKLFLFDTFSYFPPAAFGKDKQIDPIIRVLYENPPTLQEVKDNFKKFGLLDNKIKFIQGEISSNMPLIDIDKIALLRLDLDYYEPTLTMLEKYYWNVSKGGYVVIDDYNNHYLECKNAVDDFRTKYNIENPIVQSNGAVYWVV